MWNSLSRDSPASGDSWKKTQEPPCFAITTGVRLRSHTNYVECVYMPWRLQDSASNQRCVHFSGQTYYLALTCPWQWTFAMITSSNGNILGVTRPLCGEFTGHRWIPLTKASNTELDVFFDLRLNKRLSKQSWGWWFEVPSRLRHCNVPYHGMWMSWPRLVLAIN